jgi:hypothetical protein
VSLVHVSGPKLLSSDGQSELNNLFQEVKNRINAGVAFEEYEYVLGNISSVKYYDQESGSLIYTKTITYNENDDVSEVSVERHSDGKKTVFNVTYFLDGSVSSKQYSGL